MTECLDMYNLVNVITVRPICFIAARGGSKGVPRKNIRMICGKPLIAHAIESALDSKIFSHVIVSTEDNEIASMAKKHGAEIPFSRPKSLATDNVAMRDVLLHGIKKLYSLGYDFDAFVNRDCTAPFIRHKDIFGSLELLRKEKCNAVFGVYKTHFNPYFTIMEKNDRGYLKMSKSAGGRPATRQSAPVVYQLNGFFTYDSHKFLKYGEPITLPKVLPYEIPPETGWLIDTEMDFKIAELMLLNKVISIS